MLSLIGFPHSSVINFANSFLLSKINLFKFSKYNDLDFAVSLLHDLKAISDDLIAFFVTKTPPSLTLESISSLAGFKTSKDSLPKD